MVALSRQRLGEKRISARNTPIGTVAKLRSGPRLRNPSRTSRRRRVPRDRGPAFRPPTKPGRRHQRSKHLPFSLPRSGIFSLSREAGRRHERSEGQREPTAQLTGQPFSATSPARAPPLPLVPRGFSPAERERESPFHFSLPRSGGEGMSAAKARGGHRATDRPSALFKLSSLSPLNRSRLTASLPRSGREIRDGFFSPALLPI